MTATMDDLLAEVRARRDLPSPAERRAIREVAGASQAQCAEVIGVTQQAFATWETGKCLLTGSNLIAYAHLLAELQATMEATR